MCRLASSVCNSRQAWNENKCRCECDKGYSWNLSNCLGESDKSCGIREYLNYKSCVCKNTLIDKLVEERTSVIDENKIYNETLNTISSNDCASCTVYDVLFVVFLTTSVIISGALVYFYWYEKNKQLNLRKDVPDVKYSVTETMTY